VKPHFQLCCDEFYNGCQYNFPIHTTKDWNLTLWFWNKILCFCSFLSCPSLMAKFFSPRLISACLNNNTFISLWAHQRMELSEFPGYLVMLPWQKLQVSSLTHLSPTFLSFFLWEWGQRERENLKQVLRSVRSWLQGSISQLWDHDLSQNQNLTLNWLSHPGAPWRDFKTQLVVPQC